MKFQINLVIALVAFCISGCESKTDAPAADAIAQPASPKKAAKSSPSEQYSLTVANVDLPSGTMKVPVTIKPGSGFKINKEYPWKIKIESASENVKVLNEELNKDHILLKDSAATFELECEVSAAGSHKIEAVGNFSVCNDNVCKNLRDEPLTIEFVSIAK